MENNIEIKDDNYEYSNSFAKVKFHINFTYNSTTQGTDCDYYFHKCDQVEFKEVPSIPNSCDLQTIYFVREGLDPNKAHSTTQPNSNRKELENGEVQKKNTLYFVKEESES